MYLEELDYLAYSIHNISKYSFSASDDWIFSNTVYSCEQFTNEIKKTALFAIVLKRQILKNKNLKVQD